MPGRTWQFIIAAAAVTQAVPSLAQAAPLAPEEGHGVHWWQGALLLGGLSGLMLLDAPAQQFTQDNRSSTSNGLSNIFRHVGQPEVYGTITLSFLTAGLLSGQHDLTRAGGRLAASLALAGVSSTMTKLTLGRPRPYQSLDADGFVPFSGQEAMPSGHTAMAFALATSLSDEMHNRWASIGLYALAGGVGWSRLNDNRHWLTDVSAGAVLGIASAKLMSGRWRIFSVRPPSVLIGPRQAGIAWNIRF